MGVREARVLVRGGFAVGGSPGESHAAFRETVEVKRSRGFGFRTAWTKFGVY